nr:MAG TPA: hypothetical protein [Caudoviricetes sp.]
MEERIYNSWAFSVNEGEKGKINYKIYLDLKNKYKILQIADFSEPTEEQLLNNDIVYSRKACYLRGEYTLYKAPTDITTNELLLIFDKGNLCFGGCQISNNRYRVSED